MAGRLIVEHLDGETLVYDTERHEAHTLSGGGAAEFAAASDDVSRREVIRKLALAGAAAAGAASAIRTVLSPTPAHAQSATPCGTGSCPAGTTCCTPPQAAPNCCPNASTFCVSNLCLQCGTSPFLCCPGNVCQGGACCNNTGTCVAEGANCATGGPCCNGVCCLAGQTCVNNACTIASDRNLKCHLAQVVPQDVLAALGL
jgi:hypothetical protein